MLVDLSEADHGVLHGASRPRGRRAARGVRHFGTSRRRPSSAASTKRTCSPSRRPSARYRKQQGITGPLFLGFDTHALSAPAFASALEVLAANDVEVMIASGRRVHADAGDLARHPGLQPRTHERAGRWHRHHALAQSARQRRLQVQPAEWRTRRYADHRLDRDRGQSTAGGEPRRREAHAARRGAQRRDHARARFSRRVRRRSRATSSTWTRFAARRSAWASIRSAARACTTGPAIAERYGLDLTVVNDAVDADLPVHDRRLGRQDPHGSLLAVCHAGPDRAQGPLRHRLRLRHRSRPARHRHAQRRPAAAESLPGGRPSTIYSSIGRGWRADAGIGKTVVSSQMIDHVARSSDAGCTKCRWASSGSWTACSTARSGSAAKKARAPRSCARTARCGPRTRTASRRRCCRRRSRRAPGAIPARPIASSRAQFGEPLFERIDAAATPAQKKLLSQLTPEQVKSDGTGRREDPIAS